MWSLVCYYVYMGSFITLSYLALPRCRLRARGKLNNNLSLRLLAKCNRLLNFLFRILNEHNFIDILSFILMPNHAIVTDFLESLGASMSQMLPLGPSAGWMTLNNHVFIHFRAGSSLVLITGLFTTFSKIYLIIVNLGDQLQMADCLLLFRKLI